MTRAERWIAAAFAASAACAGAPAPAPHEATARPSAVASAAAPSIRASAAPNVDVREDAPLGPAELFALLPKECPRGRVWISVADVLSGPAAARFDELLRAAARTDEAKVPVDPDEVPWPALLGPSPVPLSELVQAVAACGTEAPSHATPSAASEVGWVVAARVEELPGGRPLEETLTSLLPAWKRRSATDRFTLESPAPPAKGSGLGALVLVPPRTVLMAPTRAAAVAGLSSSEPRPFDGPTRLAAWADLPARAVEGGERFPATTVELSADVEGFDLKVSVNAGAKRAQQLKDELEKLSLSWQKMMGTFSPTAASFVRVLTAAHAQIAGDWLFVNASFTRAELGDVFATAVDVASLRL